MTSWRVRTDGAAIKHDTTRSLRNEREWSPSWCVVRDGELTISRDHAELSVGSKLVASLGLAAWDGVFPRYARGRLLDLGCGKVPLYEAYRPYITDNTCVDWAESAHGNRFIDCLCDLNANLPFVDCEFDTILAASVFEHVARPDVAWREAARVLKPAGYLLLSVPFYYWIHEEPHDYFRYTEFGLRRFCEDNGLTVVELRVYGGAPEVLFDVASKTVARLSRFGPLAATGLQSLGLRVVGHWPLARISRQSVRQFPLGYVLVAQKRPVPSDTPDADRPPSMDASA